MTSSKPLLLLALLAVGACGGEEVRRRGSLEEVEAQEAAAARLAVLGERVPDFEVDTLAGTRVRLSDYLGKPVVLEWLNPLCPFTRAAHQDGTLRDYPDRVVRDGGIWLGVCSSGPGKHGSERADLEAAVEAWGFEHPVLLDPSGELGRRFDATHTPQVFLLDERSVLRFVGAVDNQPFNKVRGGGEVQNHLALALEQLRDGRPVEPAARQAYGSRVKYAQRPLGD